MEKEIENGGPEFIEILETAQEDLGFASVVCLHPCVSVCTDFMIYCSGEGVESNTLCLWIFPTK